MKREQNAMKRGEKAAIVCCSNGLAEEEKEKIQRLQEKLWEFGLQPVVSRYLYAKNSVFSGTAGERAGTLMECFREKEIKVIFDVSGGDIANEILPLLDFGEIAASEAVFCGYSDLTTVMNAIYAMTGKASLWYQAKNLVGKAEHWQCSVFPETFLNEAGLGGELFQLRYEWIQGASMQGPVVGGNVRCLLKLAGTPYWPRMQGKILFLEARSGSQAQMVAYLNQLKQMSVFEQVNGILLGTFLQLEKEETGVSMADLVRRYAGEKLPIARTADVGHRSGSRALWIGREYVLKKEQQ